MPGKQDLYLYNMGELGSSRWVITVVFFLYSNYSRHFTRLRHTLKGVNLHCFLLFYNAEIGWMFCCMSHCFGLFFYSGQFKSCFPHQSGNPCKSRVSAIFLAQKTGLECNYECNWWWLTKIWYHFVYLFLPFFEKQIIKFLLTGIYQDLS